MISKEIVPFYVDTFTIFKKVYQTFLLDRADCARRLSTPSRRAEESQNDEDGVIFFQILRQGT